MTISKNAVAGGVTALGGTGAVAGIVIANKGGKETKGITIGEKWDRYLIKVKTDYDNRWSQRGTEKTPEGVGNEEGKRTLEDWCEEKRNVVITDEMNDLLEQVKRWCIFTIKQKLTDEVLNVEEDNENPDKEDWKIRTQNLKNFEEPKEYDYFNLEDVNDIKQEVEKETDSNENTWKKLKDWCRRIYNLNHYEETHTKLKAAEKFCTKATIEDALNGTELPFGSNFDLKENANNVSKFDSVWDEQVNKAKDASNGMKDTTTKNKLNQTDNTITRRNLKSWCQDQYSRRHNETEKWGDSQTGESVLAEVKKWCVVLIKDKLTNEKKFENFEGNDDNRWGTNSNTLKDYTDAEGKPKLTRKLSEIKNESEDTKRKNKLKNWCKEAYEKGFKGNDDNLFLLVSKFCMKSE